jgi:AcrR family transcriptional regulator
MSEQDRAKTEAKLLAALDEHLRADGFDGLGVNAIARRAGVSKVLIYRYFGGLDGLYAAFAESHQLWPSVDDLLGPEPERLRELEWRDAFIEILKQYARALRERPLSVELLAWECVSRNELTLAFESVRERRAHELYARLDALGVRPPRDMRIASIVFSSALHYLVIRGRSIRMFSGVNIQDEVFWEHTIWDELRALMGG